MGLATWLPMKSSCPTSLCRSIAYAAIDASYLDSFSEPQIPAPVGAFYIESYEDDREEDYE